MRYDTKRDSIRMEAQRKKLGWALFESSTLAKQRKDEGGHFNEWLDEGWI